MRTRRSARVAGRPLVPEEAHFGPYRAGMNAEREPAS